MAQLNKITKPSLIKELFVCEEDFKSKLNEDREIYDTLIENCTLDHVNVDRAELNGCHFKNVIFNECSFENIELRSISWTHF